jgi:hypothetical protein
MLVTLVLLAVMLLGGMALARMTEVGTLASGNAAFRDAAIQASEVGINTALATTVGLVNEEVNDGGWYFAQAQGQVDGLPNVDWNAAPEIVVGSYRVRYVVERLCQGALPVTDPALQCLNRVPASKRSASSNSPQLDPPSVRQFRVTVRVTGPKDTRSWVQSLVTRG